MDICKKELCTGCGLCEYVCPQQCISKVIGKEGVAYPYIDENICISCGKCQKLCPANNKIETHEIKEVYAGWHTEEEQRRKSASGGIAFALYQYAIEHGFYVCGCYMNAEHKAKFSITNVRKEIDKFANSKYVWSDLTGVYRRIKELVSKEEKILFIGTPCQVAAVKQLAENIKAEDSIVLVEVLCHGMAPEEYLLQHIKKVEQNKKKKAFYIKFRDEKFGTSKYYFTMSDKQGNIFYKKNVQDNDVYQFGFHKNVSLRENCYNCRYAKQERVADIALSDYYGLGTCQPKVSYGSENVSCIMINTQKGKEFFEDLVMNKYIYADKRPVEEPFNAQGTLKRPIKKNAKREEFLRKYRECQNFDQAMEEVFHKDLVKNHVRVCLHTHELFEFSRRVLKKIFPEKIINKIKKYTR